VYENFGPFEYVDGKKMQIISDLQLREGSKKRSWELIFTYHLNFKIFNTFYNNFCDRQDRSLISTPICIHPEFTTTVNTTGKCNRSISDSCWVMMSISIIRLIPAVDGSYCMWLSSIIVVDLIVLLCWFWSILGLLALESTVYVIF
jgi:hypothetical protein